MLIYARPRALLGFRIAAAVVFIAAGLNHFRVPRFYASLVPPTFPNPVALGLVSGFFEITGGIGLLVPRLRRPATWGLIAAVDDAGVEQRRRSCRRRLAGASRSGGAARGNGGRRAGFRWRLRWFPLFGHGARIIGEASEQKRLRSGADCVKSFPRLARYADIACAPSPSANPTPS